MGGKKEKRHSVWRRMRRPKLLEEDAKETDAADQQYVLLLAHFEHHMRLSSAVQCEMKAYLMAIRQLTNSASELGNALSNYFLFTAHHDMTHLQFSHRSNVSQGEHSARNRARAAQLQRAHERAETEGVRTRAKSRAAALVKEGFAKVDTMARTRVDHEFLDGVFAVWTKYNLLLHRLLQLGAERQTKRSQYVWYMAKVNRLKRQDKQGSPYFAKNKAKLESSKADFRAIHAKVVDLMTMVCDDSDNAIMPVVQKVIELTSRLFSVSSEAVGTMEGLQSTPEATLGLDVTPPKYAALLKELGVNPDINQAWQNTMSPRPLHEYQVVMPEPSRKAPLAPFLSRAHPSLSPYGDDRGELGRTDGDAVGQVSVSARASRPLHTAVGDDESEAQSARSGKDGARDKAGDDDEDDDDEEEIIVEEMVVEGAHEDEDDEEDEGEDEEGGRAAGDGRGQEAKKVLAQGSRGRRESDIGPAPPPKPSSPVVSPQGEAQPKWKKPMSSVQVLPGLASSAVQLQLRQQLQSNNARANSSNNATPKEGKGEGEGEGKEKGKEKDDGPESESDGMPSPATTSSSSQPPDSTPAFAVPSPTPRKDNANENAKGNKAKGEADTPVVAIPKGEDAAKSTPRSSLSTPRSVLAFFGFGDKEEDAAPAPAQESGGNGGGGGGGGQGGGSARRGGTSVAERLKQFKDLEEGDKRVIVTPANVGDWQEVRAEQKGGSANSAPKQEPESNNKGDKGEGNNQGNVSSRKQEDTAKAKFTYDAQSEDELSFRRGEELVIVSREGDWWQAKRDGKVGFVPGNYF